MYNQAVPSPKIEEPWKSGTYVCGMGCQYGLQEAISFNLSCQFFLSPCAGLCLEVHGYVLSGTTSPSFASAALSSAALRVIHDLMIARGSLAVLLSLCIQQNFSTPDKFGPVQTILTVILQARNIYSYKRFC